jgi:betaine-aldehyde dehydrogenase
MGPVINKVAYDRVMGFIESAKEEGARLVMGGKPPRDIPGTEGGFFIEPTIFADVKPHFKIAKEEIFGPVMSVFKWSDEAEVIKVVNSTPYGLTASIYTQNINTAQRMVKKVEAGFVWVNQVGRHFLGVPFGGVKDSGVGREECLDELLSFTSVKSVNMDLS